MTPSDQASGARRASSTAAQGECLRNVDIAVVGAGLVGLPLAQLLAEKGWSVVLLDAGNSLLEAAPSLTASTSSDAGAMEFSSSLAQRCTALSLGTQRWFAQHGLWAGVAEDACPIVSVNVSHKGYFGATRLNAEEMHVPAVGYVVNNADFLRAFAQRIAQTSVQYFHNARAISVERSQSGVRLQVQGAPDIEARLLIAADGVSSLVRESAGISTTQVDYDQAAVLGMVRLSGSHDGVAYERFTASGPLAFLPRPGPFMSFVDCMDPAEQSHIEQMDDNTYLRRLQTRFGFRLGRLQAVGPRFIVPLVRIESDKQIAGRTALLGNAMRLLHPVGGQGYNLAMRDAAQLVEMLGQVGSKDPGEAELLSQWVALRVADQESTVRFTDALARGFRGKAAIPGHIRSAALLGLDLLDPLRQRFAYKTMGLPG